MVSEEERRVSRSCIEAAGETRSPKYSNAPVAGPSARRPPSLLSVRPIAARIPLGSSPTGRPGSTTTMPSSCLIPTHLVASMGPRRWSRGRGRRLDLTRDAMRVASMGPRRWSRGRDVGRRTCGRDASLQWGHGDGAVEEVGTTLSGPPAVDDSLQWGHGDGAVEEVVPSGLAAPQVCQRWASMGPRRWSRGRGYVAAMHELRVATDAASMGPRRWSRGRGLTRGGGESQPTRRFNGATAMEPWKSRGVSADASTPIWRASMGPRRWSRGRAESTSG